MQLKRWLALIFVLFILFVSQSFASTIMPYKPGHSIANVMADSEVVFVGRVTNTEFVYRANNKPQFTTDITVAVEQVVKGTPNNGENSVKFMIEGGRGVNPETGQVERCVSVGVPKFTVGDRSLFFLCKNKLQTRTIPHNGLYLFRISYGKRPIKNNRVVILYTLDDKSLKPVKMPLDLAVLIGKAAVKDKDATLLLESDIKSAIRTQTGFALLSQTLVNSLKIEAQTIIDTDTEDTDTESDN